MRQRLIEQMKHDLENMLRKYLEKEGTNLFFAANDNYINSKYPTVFLKTIDDTLLQGQHLLAEIRVIMEILGRPFQCDTIIQGIYAALQPHHITTKELSILLMTIHVEVMHPIRPKRLRKRTMMRYFIEAV